MSAVRTRSRLVKFAPLLLSLVVPAWQTQAFSAGIVSPARQFTGLQATPSLKADPLWISPHQEPPTLLASSADLNTQAQDSFERGDYTAAIATWTQLILSSPDQTTLNDALISRAKAYLVISQPGLALTDINQVNYSLKQTRELAALWLLKGVALLQMNDYAKSIDAFNNSERLLGGDAILYANRSVAYQSLGKLDEARKDLLKSISLDPTLSSYYNLAVLERRTGSYARCAALLTEIIKKSPGYFPAYLQRGFCEAALGQHELAIADMLRVLKLDPNNVEAIEQMGLSLAASGKKDAAKSYLIKASSMRLALGQVDKYQQLLKIIGGLGSQQR